MYDLLCTPTLEAVICLCYEQDHRIRFKFVRNRTAKTVMKVANKDLSEKKQTFIQIVSI